MPSPESHPLKSEHIQTAVTVSATLKKFQYIKSHRQHQPVQRGLQELLREAIERGSIIEDY